MHGRLGWVKAGVADCFFFPPVFQVRVAVL